MKRPLVESVACALGILALVAIAPSCTTEEIVLAKLPPGSEKGPGGEATKCVENVDCSPRSFCARFDCNDLGGACETRPVVCEEEPGPVCGCDGVTYWNDCLRRAAGVSAMRKGECSMEMALICKMDPGGPAPGPPDPSGPPLPSPSGGSCPPGLYCGQLLPSPTPDGPDPLPPKCFPGLPGTCWKLPAVCPLNGGSDRWIECGPAPGCIDTCDAIRSQLAYTRAVECH